MQGLFEKLALTGFSVIFLYLVIKYSQSANNLINAVGGATVQQITTYQGRSTPSNSWGNV